MKIQATPKAVKPAVAMLIERLDATRVVAMRTSNEPDYTIVFQENSPPEVFEGNLSAWWDSELKARRKYRSCLYIDDWGDITLLLTGSLK